MANIKTLYGSDKLREAYPKVNENFNNLNGDINVLRTRVNTIITTPIDGEAAAQELVDARDGEVTLGKRLDRDKQIVESHLADTTSQIGGVNADKLKKNTANTSLKLLSKKTSVPLVTFIDDDGSLEVYTRLKPIFESRGVPCTIAIVSDWVGKDNVGDWHGRAMNQKQILELQNKLGWEVASHGRTHISLKAITDPTTINNEIVLSKKELLEMGFNVQNFVYPYGQQDALIATEVNKYYNYGVTTGSSTTPNTNIFPFDDKFVMRVPLGSYVGDNNTLEFYKSAVDKAISESSWLVFMTHVWAQDETQDQYLEQTIDYILSKNVEIVNLNEAMEYYGDRLNIEGFLKIDKNNKITSDKMVVQVNDTTITSSTDADDIATIMSNYSKNHVLYTKINYAMAAGFPGNQPGILITDLSTFEKGYISQTYTTYTSNNTYIRRSLANGMWQPWDLLVTKTYFDSNQNVNIVTTAGTYTSTSPVTAFPNNKITVFTVNLANATGFPNNNAGICTTYRIGGTGSEYQEYKEYNNWNKHVRYSTGTSTWSDWKQITIT